MIGADTFQRSHLLNLLHVNLPMWYVDDTGMFNSRRPFSFFGPPRFRIKLLRTTTFLSVFTAVLLMRSWKLSFPFNHNRRYFRVVQSLIFTSFRNTDKVLYRTRVVNSTTYVLWAATHNPVDSNQHVNSFSVKIHVLLHFSGCLKTLS